MATKKKTCGGCGQRVDYNSICECQKDRRRQSNKQYLDKHGESARVLTTARWARKRKTIILRDGSICQRCLIKYNFICAENLQVHHIKNRLEFPSLIFEDENLITVCKRCNLQIGQRNELDFPWVTPKPELNL